MQKNIVLFGPPGAGKGTQSDYIKAHFNLVHLSTGNLLRSEIRAQTRLGLKAKILMDQGLLVPDKVVIGMIETQIQQHRRGNGFIFDGFPRTVEQASALDELLMTYQMAITNMLVLRVPNEELVTRLLERGKTSGRADDQNESLIRKRIVEYEKKTLPVAQYYQRQGKYTVVQGIGSIETIFKAILDTLT